MTPGTSPPKPPPSTVDTDAVDIAVRILAGHALVPDDDRLRAALAEVMAEVGPIYVEAAIAWAMDQLRRDATDQATRTALDAVAARAGTAARLIDPVAVFVDHLADCRLAASACDRCDGSATRWGRVDAVRQLITDHGLNQFTHVQQARLMLGIDVMMCVPCAPQRREPAARTVHVPGMGGEPMCPTHAAAQEHRNTR